MPEVPITPPQVIPSTKITRKYYSVSGDNTQNFGTPANTTSIGQVSVYLDGNKVPSDSADYPWIFNEDEQEVQFRTGGVPPENSGVEVVRDIFLDFGKTGFPDGYTLDARVLNRILTQGLYQAQELIEDGDIAWDAWKGSSLLPNPTPTQADDAMIATTGSAWTTKTSGAMKNSLSLAITDHFRSLSVSSTSLSSTDSVFSNRTDVENLSAVDVSSGVHGELYIVNGQQSPTYGTNPENFSQDLVLNSRGVAADCKISSHSTNLGLELSSTSSLNFATLGKYWFGTNSNVGDNKISADQVGGGSTRVGLHSALHIDSSGNFFPYNSSTNIHPIVNPTSQYLDRILPKIASKGNLIAGKAISVAGNSESGLYGGNYQTTMLGGCYTTPESNIRAAANLPDVLINLWGNETHHQVYGVGAGNVLHTQGKIAAVYRFISYDTGTFGPYKNPYYLIKFNRKIAPDNPVAGESYFRYDIQTDFKVTTVSPNRTDIKYSLVLKNTPEWDLYMTKLFGVFSQTVFPNKTGAAGTGSTIQKSSIETTPTDMIILQPYYRNGAIFEEEAYPQSPPPVPFFNQAVSLAMWLRDESEFE